MTLSNTTTSIRVAGDGLTTTFSYDFYMASANYATLIYEDATGATSSITASSFSVESVTDPDGGTFTYPLAGSPISTGTFLTLQRIVPLTQNATIANQGNFAPTIVDGALDYQMMAAQQMQAEIDVINEVIDDLTTTSISSVTTGMIANQAVTYPKFQNVQASSLVGNPTTVSTTASEITLGAGLTFSGTTLVNTFTTTTSAAMIFITSSAPTSGTTVTLSSIPDTYRHLLLMVNGKSTTTGTGIPINVTFNGDATNNYDMVQTQIINATNGASTTAGFTKIQGMLVGDSTTSGFSGFGMMHIFNYAGTTFNKVCKVDGGSQNGTSATTFVHNTGYGGWRSTASINRIDLTLNSGNWATGSFVSLYGLT